MEKDFRLLRPFDEAAAKRGDAICYTEEAAAKYIAGPNHLDTVVVQWNDGQFHTPNKNHLRMAPLGWVEGKPVYKGDVLYWTICPDEHKEGITVTGLHKNKNLSWICNTNGRQSIDGYTDRLTWTPPKVKREGFFILNSMMTKFETFDQADASMKRDYPDFHFVAKCEWEEPAGQEGGA